MPITIDFVDRPYVEIVIDESDSWEEMKFAIKLAKYLKEIGMSVRVFNEKKSMKPSLDLKDVREITREKLTRKGFR